MSVAVIVPAAGRGERLGAPGPKALVPLGGRPLVAHAVEAMAAAVSVGVVVVAAPPDAVDAVRDAVDALAPLLPSVVVVAGGATRQESVGRALAALPPDVDVVLVHDAARALAPPWLADAVVAAVHAGAAAVVPAVPVADTVKEVDAHEVVVRTLDRTGLRAVQTPQGFRRDVLERAHAAAADTDATDDAGLVEALGVAVQVVPGAPEAAKVTRPFDLEIAEALLARRSGRVR